MLHYSVPVEEHFAITVGLTIFKITCIHLFTCHGDVLAVSIEVILVEVALIDLAILGRESAKALALNSDVATGRSMLMNLTIVGPALLSVYDCF